MLVPEPITDLIFHRVGRAARQRLRPARRTAGQDGKRPYLGDSNRGAVNQAHKYDAHEPMIHSGLDRSRLTNRRDSVRLLGFPDLVGQPALLVDGLDGLVYFQI
jgi:hypothetical protein